MLPGLTYSLTYSLIYSLISQVDKSHFSLMVTIRSDEGLTLKTSALQSLSGGPFTYGRQLC